MVEQITFQTLFQFLQTAGILVGVSYYIISLRNQNLARKTQLYMQIGNKYGEQEQLEARNKYMAYEWQTAKDVLNDFNSLEGRKTIGTLVCYYEGLGIMVREGLLDIRIISLFMTTNIMRFWEKMKPFISEFRESFGSQRAFIETDYLYDTLMKYYKENPELAT